MDKMAVDELMARGAFGALLTAVRTSQRNMLRAGKVLPTFVVLSETGHTVVNDHNLALTLAAGITRSLNTATIVVQVVQLARPAPETPKEPEEGGQPSSDPPEGDGE